MMRPVSNRCFWVVPLFVALGVLAFAGEKKLDHHGIRGMPRPRTAAPSSSALDNEVFPQGIWISPADLADLPLSGLAFENVKRAADQPWRPPNLADQDEKGNVCVLAQALIYARTGQVRYLTGVRAALREIVHMPTYTGRALALGRKLPTYVIAADVVNLSKCDPELDGLFRATIKALLTTPTLDGPRNLVECHERRPNNWGTHCGAARAAVAAYLDDRNELARVALSLKGWLGDRSSYADFKFGSDLSWQCNAAIPLGINPMGCTREGHSIDGVLPDDQRRAGGFTWPPPHENYVYEALQGAMVQAVILQRAGYDAFQWQDQALLRAFQWLYTQANFPAQGDDTWLIPIINYYYRTAFPVKVPTKPGKNMGWTDWTFPPAPPAKPGVSP